MGRSRACERQTCPSVRDLDARLQQLPAADLLVCTEETRGHHMISHTKPDMQGSSPPFT